MQKKNPAKRRPERLVVTLLSLLFLSTAVFATVKYVFRAPELDTDKPVVTPDGTASTDVDRTDTDEPDAPGRTRREYCYNILVSGLDDDNGGSDTNILVRFDVPNKRIDLVSLPRDTLLHNEYRNNKLNFAYAKGGTELLMEQIENLLGIPVDFYVTVNLKGFIALIEQIGGEGTIEKRIPAMMRMFASYGIDIRKEPILVYPTLHYQNGGLHITADGQTDVENLFAAGEVVGGIHGRNRLMGNSLLDVIVFGRNAGQHAAEKAKSVTVGALTLSHVAAFEAEKQQAGVSDHRPSPQLLPDYARKIHPVK